MPLERVDTLPVLPKRPEDSHKGLYGSVLVVAGGRGMAGAAGLRGASCLRSGAVRWPYSGNTQRIAGRCSSGTLARMVRSVRIGIRSLRSHAWIWRARARARRSDG